MEENKLKISVNIAERKYELSVYPSEESDVRTAAENVNAQLKDLTKKYAFKDRQDIFAMMSLINTKKLIEHERTINYVNDSFGNRLKEIDAYIEPFLSE